AVEGCRSYEDIRTVDGVVHPTYKSACYALGLLNDDKEWNDCIKEASHLAFAPQMHQLFCTILLFCEVTDLRFTNEVAEHRPFGGMTVVLGGDFRQIRKYASEFIRR
uniref:ATP-dependent DNA helicase n=1 Tax=Aegilops tauschii subsp. strangulata TaxID=200361 RepID=A0A453HZ20_AEGTS